MLSFATEFPISQGCTTTDFIYAVRVWLLGSPHTRLVEEDLADLAERPETLVEKHDERIGTLVFVSDDEEAAGVSYGKYEDDLEWITAVVFSKKKSDSWVGVQVSRHSERPAANLPTAKKPVVVRTLLDRLGGASDGMLRVGDTPHRLDDVDVESAAQLVAGKAGCHLPLVYVSAGFHGDHIVDCDRLARDLSGMAHVVVEPNRNFSLRLQIEVDSENVYGGTVGVYWPEAAGRRSFFVGRELESPERVHRAVFEEIRRALTNRRALDRCTWSYVQEATSHQALAELRASGSQQLDKYVETFDRELAAKAQRLDKAENEISRLLNELRLYKENPGSNSGGLIQGGRERDFYSREVYGTVRDALADASERVASDSRRKHVLTAILDANPVREEHAKSMQESLKQILRGTRGVDQKSRKGLDEMGFAIAEQGKHYKLVFQGDDRYTFSLPKSSSDRRSGLNAARDIGRLLF